jgi:histone-lysine N-methyltransferase SETMAR
MLIVAYDSEGVIISHAVPAGQTVNAVYYQHFLEHNLRPAMRRKRPHFLRDNPSCGLHDNACCHMARAVSALLQRWHWEVLVHPPYSPDMSPCDYDLFPRLKEPLRGTRFQDIPSVLCAVGCSITEINRNNLADSIQRLPRIWQNVQDLAGDYIEGM